MYYHVKGVVIFVWYCVQIAAQTVHTVQGSGLHSALSILNMVQDRELLVQDGWLVQPTAKLAEEADVNNSQ